MSLGGGDGRGWGEEVERDGERKREVGVGVRLGPSQGSEGDREGPPHLGPSGPRPPAQVGTPSATAQRPSAARQSHSFSVHRGTALISSPMASPFSRGTSACFRQPASSGLQVSDEWSHALPLPSFRALWLPWLLRHRHRCGATGSAPPRPACCPPASGEKAHHPSSPALMKSSFCSVPRWARGRCFTHSAWPCAPVQ